jgi:hypothetical protein
MQSSLLSLSGELPVVTRILATIWIAGETVTTAQFMMMLQQDNFSIPLSVTNAAMQGIVYRDYQ